MALVLLVEDDLLIGRMITIRLKMRGHDVEIVTDGRQAVDRALAGAFDLILMDMHMPIMDGHEAVSRLRAQGYPGKIIAVTASAMSEDSQKAMKVGCDHFIAKPIPEDFEDRIQAILAEPKA